MDAIGGRMTDTVDRPGAGSRFYKAHGLGNDYLVFEEGNAWRLTPRSIRTVCDRWRGVGGDGIVLILDGGGPRRWVARMFNPDGSEFERSGNGLRVLGSFLSRSGLVGGGAFLVSVGGEEVSMAVRARSLPVYDVSVDMGPASVGPGAIGLDPDALDRHGRMEGPGGESLDVIPVRVGNPHLVVVVTEPTAEDLQRWGPFLSGHPAIPAGTNVQIAAVKGPGRCRALVWERGVGRTSASGTSACAVAVAAVHRGAQEPGTITVAMEGGDLGVEVSPDLTVVLRGPVEEVLEGNLTQGFLRALA
jgi:diaminopimelate epimerase